MTDRGTQIALRVRLLRRLAALTLLPYTVAAAAVFEVDWLVRGWWRRRRRGGYLL